MLRAWDLLMDPQLCSPFSNPCTSCRGGSAQIHSPSPVWVFGGPHVEPQSRTETVTSGSTNTEFLLVGLSSQNLFVMQVFSDGACQTGPHSSVFRHVSALVSICADKCRLIEKIIPRRSLIQSNTSTYPYLQPCGVFSFQWYTHLDKSTSCSWDYMSRRRGCADQLSFSVGNYSFRSPFCCKSLGAGVSHAKNLRGWSGSVGCRMVEEEWEAGEEKSHCTLTLLILIVVLHEVAFAAPAAAPAQELPPVYKTDFPVPLCDCHPSCAPCTGSCLCPWAVPVSPGTAGRAAPCPLPSMRPGWKRNLRSWDGDCCEGCLSSASAAGWTSLKARESEENPQSKFWKNLYQTIPVVGTAVSEMQTHFPFISATVLSCFINNRLVWETDKMGTSTVITHCSFCEDCHENNTAFSFSPKTSRETNF